jgi:hypothetical protein
MKWGRCSGGKLEPGDDLVDAFFVGKFIVEGEVVAGPDALNGGLGAGPEEAGAPHALLLGEDPEGGSAIPTAVGFAGLVGIGVALLAGGVVEAVGDDAVVLGVESGDQGVVVGEGERGVGGNHAIGSGCAFLREGEDVFGGVFLGVVVAEAVEGDEYDVVFGLGGGGVGRVWGGEDGAGLLSLDSGDAEGPKEKGAEEPTAQVAKFSGHRNFSRS